VEEDDLQPVLNDLSKLIEVLKGQDYEAVELAIQGLVCRFLEVTKVYRIPDLSGQLDERLYGLLSESIEEYLGLADRLFGNSPHVVARKELEQTLKDARSSLNSLSVDAAERARSLIDDALNRYHEELKKIEVGGYFDHKAMRVFWKLWPAMDLFIQHLSPEAYRSLSNELYGIVSEGLRSKEAVTHLKKHFDEVFPFKESIP
jgi:hypothetical protein